MTQRRQGEVDIDSLKKMKSGIDFLIDNGKEIGLMLEDDHWSLLDSMRNVLSNVFESYGIST